MQEKLIISEFPLTEAEILEISLSSTSASLDTQSAGIGSEYEFENEAPYFEEETFLVILPFENEGLIFQFPRAIDPDADSIQYSLAKMDSALENDQLSLEETSF